MRDDRKAAFEKAGGEDQASLACEFYQMLRQNKKFWMIPLILVLLIFGLILILGGTSAAPFIYTVF